MMNLIKLKKPKFQLKHSNNCCLIIKILLPTVAHAQ